MIHRNNILVLVIVLLSATIQVDAQKVSKAKHIVDSLLTKRYLRTDFDTNYISRPKTKWTLTGRINMSGAKINTEGQYEGRHYETDLEADYKTTVSVGVSYLGLSLNLSLNPAKLLGKYHDYELGFRSYGKRFGFDITYQDARNFNGWQKIDGAKQDITTSGDMLRLQTLNVNTYYVFNSRRFSYPAAMAHSYIQRRSAGSFLLAASGHVQNGKLKDEEESIDLKMTNIGIGAGYGYNFVPGHGWLLHISSLPTLIVYTHSSLKVDNSKIPLNYHFPEVIITGRGAIVKQIGSNKFAGFSIIGNITSIGKRDNLFISNQKWLARLYFGFRL